MEGISDIGGRQLEKDYVRQTYDNIAEDFSSTRYKKWPKVDAFLRALPKGSLNLDVGCGNGKYLDNPTSVNIGCDASLQLLKICRGFEVVLCDMLRLPFRDNLFDSVICVAALHHLVSEQRRKDCLEVMVRTMSPYQSQLLVQVWAYEQDIEQDNPYIKRNCPAVGRDSGSSQGDVLTTTDGTRIPIHKNRTPFKNQDVMVPFKTKSKSSDGGQTGECSSQFLRYYHVFKRNELNSMIEKVPDVVILDSHHDRGNWCVIAGKGTDRARGS